MSDVEKIKERLSITDVVAPYVKIEKVGMNSKARCPFHNEKTASFHISEDRGLYYCFGCGAKGDIFTFIQEFEGLDFPGALKFLADKAGIELSGNKSNKDERDVLFSILDSTKDFFSSNLVNNKKVKDYIFSRGIKVETIDKFNIGYALDSWDSLYVHLKKEGFLEKDIEKSGLIKHNQNNTKRYYDRFRNRLMFPIKDSIGRVVGFSGRILSNDTKEAKYINSPETILFNKSDILYGYDIAKTYIKKVNASILVEGQIDLVLSHQAGYPYTVASSGTSFTGSHMKRIERLSNNLIIIFDRDKAGILSAGRTAKMALSFGMNVKLVLLPKGKDPADVIKNDLDLWKKLIKSSKHVIGVYIEEITKQKNDKREYWNKIRKHVLPLVDAVNNSIDQAYFIEKIYKITGIPEESIKIEIEKIDSGINEINNNVNDIINKDEFEDLSRLESITHTLNAIVLWQKSIKKQNVDVNYIVNKMKEILNDKYTLQHTNDIDGIIFKLEFIYKDNDSLKDDAEDLLIELEKEILKKKLLNTTRKLKKLNNDQSLLKQHQDLSKKLHSLNNK